MAHFRLDPPRINKDDKKHRFAYCHECLERFTASDVRCSYGTRFFHKGCYMRWQAMRMSNVRSLFSSGLYGRCGGMTNP
jgi:hypothetical protein